MKVSVVIPTFNRAGLLVQAIDSVLRQTYANLEVVVVDDGSTDDTASVAARYATRVKYVRQANRGAGAARNLALRHVTGDCIAFLDSDDMWLDFKVSLQVALLEALPDVGFLFTEFLVLKDDGACLHGGSRRWLERPVEWGAVYPRSLRWHGLARDPSEAPGDFSVYVGPMYRMLLDNPYVLPSTAVVRRSALDASTRFAEGPVVFEDWEFFARLSRRCEVAFADVETTVNRGHARPDRLTRCSRLTKALRYLEMLDDVWKSDPEFCARYAEDVQRAESRALLEVAREALLESRRDVARDSLARWRALSGRRNGARARAYGVLVALPAGRHVLRGATKGRTLARILTRRGHGTHPVNPPA